MSEWAFSTESGLLAAHATLVKGLVDDAGRYRAGGVGVMNGSGEGAEVVHMAPPANRVPMLMSQLLSWLANSKQHPLISSSVFHYEFEFIHPFTDGNGRMGRLWQALILKAWNPLLSQVPVESLIHEHQGDYYAALNHSTQDSDSGAFIKFMLTMIRDATAAPPADSPQVTPQVKSLVAVLKAPMSREQLQQALGLSDRKSFRSRYLLPALEAGLIEMTLPDKPNSRLQQYQLTATEL